ncbi:MAG TPA: glutamyl-tRNA reductase [Candidatus Nitrosotenuis sp.]|jgi:glutamyl-tRNA reductase|nr:glutamyl-tRNA reductase [Candidatus Nitrosotenuis sp.]
MPVVLVGVNHKTAPVEVRERLAFGAEGLQQGLTMLREGRGVAECAIVSTCNRTEIYAAPHEEETCRQTVLSFLEARHSGCGPHLYHSRGEQAVSHLFTVSSGLDSMILGENQILGQVRAAYETARRARATGPVLDRLFPWAVRVGKRARAETRISQGAASVSMAAVELARRIFGDLARRRVLVLGAGKISELTLKLLTSAGVSQLSVVNRTPQRAAELALRCGGQAVPFEDLDLALVEADILLSSTGAPHYIVSAERMRRVMRARRHRPVLAIDMAVPRDLDPACQEIDNVYLFNIDDLQDVVTSNLAERQREVARVAELIRVETRQFLRDLESRRAVPAIVLLRRHFEDLRRQEVEKVAGSLSPEERARLDRFSRDLMARLLHRPMVHLRELGASGASPEELARSLEIFGLGGDAPGSVED